MELRDSLHKKLDKGRMTVALQTALRLTMKDVSETSSMKAPHITGNLRRSHSYDVTGGSGGTFTGVVKNSANYWVYVNYGTSKFEGRHFLDDAVEQVNIPSRVKEYFNKEMKL